MVSKKTNRYEKLLPTQTESLICRLKQYGFEEISFNNTERYTVFFLSTDFDDSVIAFLLTPTITSITQHFFINNKRFY